MIRINIKDGQISSRKYHPAMQQQQEQEKRRWQPAAAAGQSRRRVITTSTAGGAAFSSDSGAAKSNYWDCTTALTKAIIGAGGCNCWDSCSWFPTQLHAAACNVK